MSIEGDLEIRAARDRFNLGPASHLFLSAIQRHISKHQLAGQLESHFALGLI